MLSSMQPCTSSARWWARCTDCARKTRSGSGGRVDRLDFGDGPVVADDGRRRRSRCASLSPTADEPAARATGPPRPAPAAQPTMRRLGRSRRGHVDAASTSSIKTTSATSACRTSGEPARRRLELRLGRRRPAAIADERLVGDLGSALATDHGSGLTARLRSTSGLRRACGLVRGPRSRRAIRDCCLV